MRQLTGLFLTLSLLPACGDPPDLNPNLDVEMPGNIDDGGTTPKPGWSEEPYVPCQGATEEQRHEIVFEQTEECRWGENGNLLPRDLFIQAREAQVYEIDLDGREVCDFEFEFAASRGGIAFDLQYDDHLLLTANDRVIFSSDRRLVVDQVQDQYGLYVFDWETVKGMPMDFRSTPWGLGEDAILEFPDSDVGGTARISIDDDALSDLASAAEEELTFSLLAFGDDNSASDETRGNGPVQADCSHTGVSFWVKVFVDAGR